MARSCLQIFWLNILGVPSEFKSGKKSLFWCSNDINPHCIYWSQGSGFKLNTFIAAG